MSEAPVLSAIVPCFNEEESVALLASRLVPALEKLGTRYEIVAVDDGSRDRTAERLAESARAHPELRVERHDVNRGLGAAVITGLTAARGEWAVVLDADMTFAPEQIAALWAEQRRSGADCVLGSPVKGSFEGVSWRRRLPSLLINAVYGALFSLSVTAYTPIFRLYRMSLLRELPLCSQGFEINAEIAVLLLRRGAKMAEVPVALSTRAFGASKLRRFRELARHARLIARLLGSGPR